MTQATTTSQSHLGRVARAASLMMVLFIMSRALGLLRQIIIARQFGTTAEIDAYWAAFRLPDFLFYVVAGGALGSAFIPVFTGYLAREDLPGAWRLASGVISWITLILTILSGIAAIFAPALVTLFLPDFTPDQQALTAELMRWMLISTVIFGVSGVLMGILNARQHFLLPGLAPIIYNLSIIFGALFLGPIWGVRGLTAGVVIGAVGHLLVQIPGLIQHQMRFRPNLNYTDPYLREVGRLMAPRVLGLAAVQINFVVTTFLAASLAVGSITALQYAWIIMLLPQGIIAQSVATALFPTLAALAAKDDVAEMRRIFGLTLRNLLFLTLPAAIGLLILREPIVRLLLERGEFTAQSTQLTAWALGFFAIGLVGHAVVEIATRAFYALKDTKTPVIIAVLTMIINVIFSLWFMQLFESIGWSPLGGLALANSVAVLLEMVVLLYLLKPRMDGLADTGLLVAVSKMLLITLIMGAMLQFTLPYFGFDPIWLSDLLVLALGGLIYGALAYIFRLEELMAVLQRVLRR